MSKQTGKGRSKGSRQKREAAFERHAAGHSVQHHEFVGEAEPERAEAEFLKADRAAQAEEKEVVREMAQELEKEASALRVPRSIDDARELFEQVRSPEVRERLREKARERLSSMPEPVRFTLGVAEKMATLVMRPVQRGVRLVSDVLSIPVAIVRMFRRREA